MAMGAAVFAGFSLFFYNIKDTVSIHNHCLLLFFGTGSYERYVMPKKKT
jgi:hypothetical protein